MNSKTARSKPNFIFYFLLAAVPFVFFGLMEMALRIFTDDPVTALVVERDADGKKYYQLNSRVGERFFLGGVEAFPEVYPEKFAYEKSPGTLRVFCLGSSTMASFPYELNARVSSLLQDRLQNAFPDKHVEVINAGMAAINSYAVAEFARELVAYQPDAFVMYMGHNEFYGALGVGSTQSLGQNRWLIRAYLRLQKLRIFRFLEGLVRSLQKQEAPVSPANQTLMEVVAREKNIRAQSELFQRGVDQFRENLNEIIRVAQQHHVPILIGTLASNLRDMEPFESGFAPERSEAEKQKWQSYFAQGLRLQRADSVEAALAAYAHAAAIDDEPAILHYRMAELYLARQDSLAALDEFKRARDLDVLRFRAPGVFNDIIRESCKEFSVPLVDVEGAFARQSRYGIVGHELITEHLHPNFDGYFLMAKSFAEAIRQSGVLKSPESYPPSPDDELFYQFSAVTEFDLEVGARKIERLVHRWPFRADQLRTDVKSKTPENLRQLVDAYQMKKIAWNEGHYRLAEMYQRNGEPDKAIREYRAVIKVAPEIDAPYTRIADIWLGQNRFADAGRTLQEALLVNTRSPFLYAKLGLVNFLQKNFSDAAQHFLKAIEVNQGRWLLQANDLSSANYYLALSEIQLGRLEPAKLHLAEVLRYHPQHGEAGRLLELLKKGIPVQLQF